MPPSPLTSGTARLAQRLRLRRETLARRPRLYAAIVILCLALLAAIAWPFTIAHLQSIAVLDLVANQPVPKPLRWLVTGPVTTTELILPLPSGPIRARLYTPIHHPHAPAIMVIHGVHYLGMNEPRLIAFATAMSACGLRVLTPELPDISDYHIGANSIATIGDTAAWLSAQQDHHPVGIIGLSFSGSLSLLAAAAPHFRPSMKFIVAIGSEDEMSRVANYYRTGQDPRPNGTEEVLPPHEYGALVLEYENLEDFVPKADLGALRYLLRTHLYENAAAERSVLSTLTPGQAAEAKQLMDTTSPITRRELAAIEIRHIQDMAGVSPHGNLSHLTTPVYLLHGEADNIIPSAETQWLEADLPSETLKASLISPVLSHLDLDGKGPTLTDQMRLVHFFALILHAADSR
jgi:pimeloyl-ACP methyl ester carboxylesterase